MVFAGGIWRASKLFAYKRLRVNGWAGDHTPSPPYIYMLIHFERLWSVHQLARQLQRLQRVWNGWSILDIYRCNPGGLISIIVRY